MKAWFQHLHTRSPCPVVPDVSPMTWLLALPFDLRNVACAGASMPASKMAPPVRIRLAGRLGHARLICRILFDKLTYAQIALAASTRLSPSHEAQLTLILA